MKSPKLPIRQYLEGSTFYVILFLIALIFQFAKIIHWPWIWVFSFLWIPLGISTVAIIASIPFFLIDYFKEKRK